jgi:hypothetical protein
MVSRARGVLDTPPSRGMTAVFECDNREAVGWAERSEPTIYLVIDRSRWARRKRAFAHPTILAPRQ